MEIKNKIKELFRVIDGMDSGLFTSFLTDDVRFCFGNMPVVEGKEKVGEAVSGFYSSIKYLSHEVDNIWVTGDVAVCNGTVTYTRHDSGTLSVPFANIFRIREDLIKDYRIYADISGLYS